MMHIPDFHAYDDVAFDALFDDEDDWPDEYESDIPEHITFSDEDGLVLLEM